MSNSNTIRLQQPVCQHTITPHNYPSVAHNVGIRITNVSNRDAVNRLLRPDVDPSMLIRRVLHSHQEAYMEDDILRYFKTRTHHVVVPKDGVNNPTETEVNICPICQEEFEQEQTIGTLGCGHEYHTGCIKQWLMRKKDCPMCRASVLPFTSA